MKQISIYIVLLLLAVRVHAQLTFNFLPEIHGRSVDGLAALQVQYLGIDKMAGRLFITVKENTTNTMVVTIVTPVHTFTPGTANLPKSLFNASTFNFARNAYGAITNQTRTFPAGEYTFCFKFDPSDKGTHDEYEACFDGSIQPLVPLALLNPAHQDTLCQKRPLLTWQPPLPFHAGVRFRLLLTEKKSEEAIENLIMNTPLLLLDNISATSINYPTSHPELKEGHTYVWQVVAYEKGMITSKSEIWEFTVQCKEALPRVPNDSYRELKLLANGNYYIASGMLKFTFLNNYNVDRLQYSIHDIGEGGQSIKRIPDVKLIRGINKIDVDLRDLGLTPGDHYLLRVYPFNESPVDVRFIYNE
jgi:hypothetical protein